MTSLQARRLFLIISLMLSTVGCDQVTKVLARKTLQAQTFSYMGGILRLQHSENTGAFLSFGANFPPTARFLIFTVFIAIFLVVAFWLLLRKGSHSLSNTIALTLILSGGIGNLIDRAWRGSVTDFMNFGIGWLRTGIFNVADMAIVAGVILMLIVHFRDQSLVKRP